MIEPSTAPILWRTLIRALGAGGLLLVGVTYRLWLPQHTFPQVPWFGFLSGLPEGVDAAALAGLVLGLVRLLLGLGREVNLRRWLLFTWLALSVLLLGDQQRLQPWAYQWWLFLLILASASPRRALFWCQALVISVYLYSGISKLDYVFLHHLGQQLAAAATAPLGFDPTTWPEPWPVVAAACLPAGELLVGLGLLVRRVRPAAAWLAIGMHTALILILGPTGLGHAWGVLAWNLMFIVFVVLLFFEKTGTLLAGSASSAKIDSESESENSKRFGWVAEAVAMLALVLPAGAIWGLVDEWPAWGLYSPRASLVKVLIPSPDVARLPAELQSLLPNEPPGAWVEVPLDRWALQSLGTPIYPDARPQLGVAAGLLNAAEIADRSQVIVLGVSSRWADMRDRHDYTGAGGLVEASRHFFWNTQPRPNLQISRKWR